jgi:predicted nuclease of restriction endonuclease-like (RecB) superfamily
MSNEIKIDGLLSGIKQLIEQSRSKIAVSVNATITLLYWEIGQTIGREVLQNERAGYGKQIIVQLAQQLSIAYGGGWSEKQLRHCIRFAETFPDKQIVSTLSRQFSWSHFQSLIYIEQDLKREFYIQLCKLEKWSVRTLRGRIGSMLYERTAISSKPEETIKNDLELLRNEQQLSPDMVFRDPYFLGLKDSYSEKDLESAILAELQRFIIEMGSDFAFLARQKRIVIDNRDYKIDLLFYHRRLKSLVAIDLKIGEFEAGYKGQMELYLRYLEKHEMVEGENTPIGLILCTGKNEEHIELMQLDKSNIRVADYLTDLPSQKVFQDKLHQAVLIAQNTLNNNFLNNLNSY